jgi:hypothetical protein
MDKIDNVLPRGGRMAAKKKGKKTPAKPAAKKKAPAKPATKAAAKPAKSERTPADLAAFLGVKLHKPLDPVVMKHFRRGLPGYIQMLDDVAAGLDSEAVDLALTDVTSAALRDAKAKLLHLHAVEDVAQAVYRSVYEERLQEDNDAIGMMQKVHRRIGSYSEDHPEILARWKFLRDFMARFHSGGRKTQAAEPADGTPAEG